MSTTSSASSSSSPPSSILSDLDLSLLSDGETAASSGLDATQGVKSDGPYLGQAERRTRTQIPQYEDRARSKGRLKRRNNRGMDQLPISRDFFLVIILCFGIACAAICATRVAIFARYQNRGSQDDLISDA